MQQPYGNSPGYYPPPRRSPWPMILGIGCGGCALLVIASVIGLYFVGRNVVNVVKNEVSKPGTPPPAQYVGVWDSQDGQKLTIRSDGHGDFHGNSGGSGHVSVDGGRVEIDKAAKTLKVSIFGIGRTFHIDKPPAEGKQGMEMTLDGTLFRQSFGAPSNPGAPHKSSGGGETI